MCLTPAPVIEPDQVVQRFKVVEINNSQGKPEITSPFAIRQTWTVGKWNVAKDYYCRSEKQLSSFDNANIGFHCFPTQNAALLSSMGLAMSAMCMSISSLDKLAVATVDVKGLVSRGYCTNVQYLTDGLYCEVFKEAKLVSYKPVVLFAYFKTLAKFLADYQVGEYSFKKAYDEAKAFDYKQA